MYHRILVPLDGSKFATEALPLSRLLASKVGAKLHLVHVIPQTLGFEGLGGEVASLGEIREAVGAYLHERAAEGDGLHTKTTVREGAIVPELHNYIDAEKIDLVVMTSHGTGGLRRLWRGSVAEGLVTAGGADLLMVQPWDETADFSPDQARFTRILVPLDGTPHAESALPRARELAALFGADLVLIRVVPAPIELTSIYGVPGVELAGAGHVARIENAEQYLDSIASGITEGPCETHVVEGPGAAEGIIESARGLGADLIVLAGHGRSGVERVILGSVTDKVMRGTTRPVLVVRRPHA